MSKNNYVASDQLIAWTQSLSGMLTTIKTKYGSIAEMVEHADWDENKTQFALALIESLHRELGAIKKELVGHVSEKFG